MALATVTGYLKDVGLVSLGNRAPELVFEIDEDLVTAGSGTLIPDEPITVIPGSDGSFSVDLHPSAETNPYAPYKLTVNWQSKGVNRSITPKWRIFVPAGGGTIADMIAIVTPTKVITKGDKGDSGNAVQQAAIDSLTAKNVTQDSRLDGVESKNAEQDGRLTTNESKNTTQDTRLTNVEAKNAAQDVLITQNTVWMGQIGSGGNLNNATGVRQRVSLYEITGFGAGVANMPPNPYQGQLEVESNYDGRRIIQRVTYDDTSGLFTGIYTRRGVDSTGAGAWTFQPWVAQLNQNSLEVKPKTILSNMTGWVAGAGPATYDLAVADPVIGSTSVAITTDGGTAFGNVDKTGLNFSLNNRGLTVWLKVTNAASVNSLYVRAATDSSFGHSYSSHAVLSNGGYGKSPLKEGEWFPVNISAGNFYLNNGTPTRDVLTVLRVYLQGISGQPAPTVTIGGVASFRDRNPSYPRGVISICFDDTWASHATVAGPKLASKGFPATEYLVSSRVDTAGNLTMTQLRALQEVYGWEVAAHASNDAAHTDWSLQTSGWVATELAAQKSWADANGFKMTSFAYPIGPFTSSVARQASVYYDSARSTFPLTNSAKDPHAHRLSCTVVNSATSTASVQTLIDRTVAGGGWLVLMFHDIVASGATGNAVLQADFNTIIDAVASSGLPVATVGDVIRSKS